MFLGRNFAIFKTCKVLSHNYEIDAIINIETKNNYKKKKKIFATDVYILCGICYAPPPSL